MTKSGKVRDSDREHRPETDTSGQKQNNANEQQRYREQVDRVNRSRDPEINKALKDYTPRP